MFVFASFFFYKKGFKRTKCTKPNTNDFRHLRIFCACKNRCLVVFCSLIFVLLVGFCLICVFVRSRCFRKKNINRSEIVLIASIHYTTYVYPYQPPSWELLFINLSTIFFTTFTFFSCVYNHFRLWTSYLLKLYAKLLHQC